MRHAHVLAAPSHRTDAGNGQPDDGDGAAAARAAANTVASSTAATRRSSQAAAAAAARAKPQERTAAGLDQAERAARAGRDLRRRRLPIVGGTII